MTPPQEKEQALAHHGPALRRRLQYLVVGGRGFSRDVFFAAVLELKKHSYGLRDGKREWRFSPYGAHMLLRHRWDSFDWHAVEAEGQKLLGIDVVEDVNIKDDEWQLRFYESDKLEPLR